MELKITTLIENMPDTNNYLKYEHGLSLYIEFRGKKILFDTGQTGDFLKNAEMLGMNLADIDFMVVSHGHYDHSGGVMRLLNQLDLKKKIIMYVGKEFFDCKYKLLDDGTYKYNGNIFTERDLQQNFSQVIEVSKVSQDITYIGEDIMLFKNFARYTDYELPNQKFWVKHDSEYVLDDFRDEIALGLRTTKGLVLIVGCSHVGIINIIENVRMQIKEPIYTVIGGTHLVEADESRMDKTIATLKLYSLEHIAVSHCTGEVGIQHLQEVFGDKFIVNNTGNVYCV